MLPWQLKASEGDSTEDVIYKGVICFPLRYKQFLLKLKREEKANKQSKVKEKEDKGN